jgi:hypothetical protein
MTTRIVPFWFSVFVRNDLMAFRRRRKQRLVSDMAVSAVKPCAINLWISRSDAEDAEKTLQSSPIKMVRIFVDDFGKLATPVK